MIIRTSSFSKSSVFEMFSVHTKTRKVDVFKFLRFEERFQRFRFRDGLVWTVGQTVEIKLRFQISPVQQQYIHKVKTRFLMISSCRM